MSMRLARYAPIKAWRTRKQPGHCGGVSVALRRVDATLAKGMFGLKFKIVT
jgi:hypothetical protein